MTKYEINKYTKELSELGFNRNEISEIIDRQTTLNTYRFGLAPTKAVTSLSSRSGSRSASRDVNR